MYFISMVLVHQTLEIMVYIDESFEISNFVFLLSPLKSKHRCGLNREQDESVAFDKLLEKFVYRKRVNYVIIGPVSPGLVQYFADKFHEVLLVFR